MKYTACILFFDSWSGVLLTEEIEILKKDSQVLMQKQGRPLTSTKSHTLHSFIKQKEILKIVLNNPKALMRKVSQEGILF